MSHKRAKTSKTGTSISRSDIYAICQQVKSSFPVVFENQEKILAIALDNQKQLNASLTAQQQIQKRLETLESAIQEKHDDDKAGKEDIPKFFNPSNSFATIQDTDYLDLWNPKIVPINNIIETATDFAGIPTSDPQEKAIFYDIAEMISTEPPISPLEQEKPKFVVSFPPPPSKPVLRLANTKGLTRNEKQRKRRKLEKEILAGQEYNRHILEHAWKLVADNIHYPDNLAVIIDEANKKFKKIDSLYAI